MLLPPSVQRRGGFKNVAHSAGDSNKVVAHFVGESQENQFAENDVSDIDANNHTDLPLNAHGKQGKPDEFETPLAATTTTEQPRTGDCLFTLEAATSLSILKELILYNWQQERVTDLGLTSVYGVPRLGIRTLRHAQLIMQVNFHVRRLLKDDVVWSTISIDASNEEREPQHEHKRTAPSIALVVGAYSGGFTYSMDGLAQLKHKDVASLPPTQRPSLTVQNPPSNSTTDT